MEKYKIIKYGQWGYGIFNTKTRILLRVNIDDPDYDGPLVKENKPLLFKSKEKAQEYIDKTLQDNLIESKKKSEIKPIFAKWDNDRKCIIISKEEYDRWDD